MKPVSRIAGIAAPLPLDNVDTDMILPGRYLKTISRSGLRDGLFAQLRRDEDGNAKPDFILNRPGFDEARILVSGENFGCGSSREHAPWALLDYGIECVVASNFADIFFGNCVNCGLLPARVAKEKAAVLARRLAERPTRVTVDLGDMTIALPDEAPLRFHLPAAARERLMRGLDLIDETLVEEADIAAYEADHRARLGWSRRIAAHASG